MIILEFNNHQRVSFWYYLLVFIYRNIFIVIRWTTFRYALNKANKKNVNVISFSYKKKSDIYLLGVQKFKNYHRLKVNVKNRYFYFDTKYSTNNFISNILACISIMFALDLDLNRMRKKFLGFKQMSSKTSSEFKQFARLGSPCGA